MLWVVSNDSRGCRRMVDYPIHSNLTIRLGKRGGIRLHHTVGVRGDDRVGVSNGCDITGSCAVVVGDDTFVLFLTGLDEGSFCPEIL